MRRLIYSQPLLCLSMAGSVVVEREVGVTDVILDPYMASKNLEHKPGITKFFLKLCHFEYPQLLSRRFVLSQPEGDGLQKSLALP